MGRLLEPDEEDWNVPDAEVLKELSPLQEPRQHGLFQRIVRQRASYFSDVEMIPKGIEDEDGMPPPSGFADLSTWCCDAFPSARQRSAALAGGFQRDFSLADQPTVVLALLTPAQMQIADIPTVPDLSERSIVPLSGTPRQKRVALWSKGRWCRAIASLWHHFTRAWRATILKLKHAGESRPALSPGQALLMQRVREREQLKAFGSSSTSQHTRQVRLPADRLLR